MEFVTRIKFHTLRHKGEIVWGSGIIAMLMLMLVFAFPKNTAAISGYVSILTESGLEALFSTIDVNAPGWLFWISLMSTAYLYIVSAIVALRIGAKLFPMEEKSAMELITSSPQSSRSYFMENILAAMVALFIVYLPSFIILAGYSVAQDAIDTIPRIGILFVLSMVVAIFFVSITAFVSVFTFSTGNGTKLGYFYLFLGFMIDLGSGAVEGYSEIGNLSINTYIAPAAGLLNGEHNWVEAGIVFLVSVVLLSLATFQISKPDFIEHVKTKRKFNITFLPKFSPKGKLASKYPIMFDQFRKDRSYMFIWAMIVIVAYYYIALIFEVALASNPDMLAQMVSSFGGFLDIFTYGYSVPPNYVGFLSFEVLGIFWGYYGLFLLFPAISIANRDQKNDEQDLIWSNNITPTQVIIQRTMAIFIYFSIYYWIAGISLWSTGPLLGLELDAGKLFIMLGIGYLHYIGLMFLFVAITLFFPIREGRKYALRFYLISLIFLIMSFLEPSVDFLRNLSVVYLYDPVGLMLGEVEVWIQVLKSSLLLVVAVIGYVIGLKTRYYHTDLLA